MEAIVMELLNHDFFVFKNIDEEYEPTFFEKITGTFRSFFENFSDFFKTVMNFFNSLIKF